MVNELEPTDQGTEQVEAIIPEWRNPIYNRHGTVDIEIKIGETWLPFTADPNDIETHGRDLHAAVMLAGNVAPYAPPSPEDARKLLPDLSRKQLRLGMRNLGITSAMIESAIAAIADEDAREVAQIELEDSASYSRMHPLIAQLAAAFSLTEEQIDTAWQQALNFN